MSAAYGPMTGTVGALIEVDISPASDFVQIRNDSFNDLLVQFGPAPIPSAAASAGGQWANAVPAWDHPVIPCGNGGRFDGRVWLMPINNGGLAGAGTLSVRNSIYVVAYDSTQEPVPVGSSLPRQQDVTSQARVVSVPISSLQNFAARSGNLASGVQIRFSLAQPTAAQLAIKRAVVYLYHADLHLASIGTLAGWSVDLEAYPGDASNNPIAGFLPVVFFVCDLYGSNNGSNSVFQARETFAPPHPLRVGLNWSALSITPANLCFRINIVGGSGAAQLVYNVGVDVDQSNTVSSPGSIGNEVANLFGAPQGDPGVF